MRISRVRACIRVMCTPTTYACVMLPTGVEEITHTQTMLDTAMAVLYLLRAWRSLMYSIRRHAGIHQ